MARSVLFWGNILALVGIGTAVVVALAGMDDPLAAGATVITIAAALGIPVVWGGLQGSGRFYSLSGAQCCSREPGWRWGSRSPSPEAALAP